MSIDAHVDLIRDIEDKIKGGLGGFLPSRPRPSSGPPRGQSSVQTFKNLDAAMRILRGQPKEEKQEMFVNVEDRKKVMEVVLAALGSEEKPKTYNVEELWVLGKLCDIIQCKITVDGKVEMLIDNRGLLSSNNPLYSAPQVQDYYTGEKL